MLCEVLFIIKLSCSCNHAGWGDAKEDFIGVSGVELLDSSIASSDVRVNVI